MKKIFLFFLFAFSSGALLAQKTGQALIDSMFQELSRQKNDTGKAKLLNLISYSYYTIDADTGLRYGNEALKLSETLAWKTGIAMSNKNIGVNYLGKSDYPLALEYEFISLKQFSDLADKGGIQSTQENIGIVYMLQKNNDKALEYELASLKLAKELGDKRKISNIEGNIAACYYNMGDETKALEYARKALEISEEINDRKNIAKNLGNIGNMYTRSGNYAFALHYDANALNLYKEIGDKYGAARNLGNIGNIYLEIVNNPNRVTPPDSLIPPGDKARLALAITYLKQSIVACKEIDYQDAGIPFTQILSNAYAKAGNYKEALEYQRQYMQLKDSIFSIENSQKIKELENKQAIDIKEKDIQLAKLAVAKKQNERVFYIAGIAVLVLIICIVLRNYYAQKKINSLLHREKIKSDGLTTDLQASLQQKEILMKEIHHRVKNNLQVISNLLELQSNRLDDKVAKAAIAVGQGRIKSIGLIHQKLYQNEDIMNIEVNDFFRELYNQVATVFMQPGQNVEVNFDIAQIILDIDTAIPLGLIMNELLTNAFKYAFLHEKKGVLNISLHQNRDYFLLQVSDNGPGLPDNRDLMAYTSLGMKLISRLAKQIGGYSEYQYNNGALFSIYFKDNLTRRKTL